ncbi:MAG: ABC transporter permease [Planctomycetota bacterium]|nr:ABC transporter permease [Planctomycetota bacterium]
MGRVIRGFKLGLKSLLLHKLRSGLTVLGIVFGVAAVIAMLAIGEGASRKAQKDIQDLGATNIIVRSEKPSDESQASSGRPARILNYGIKYDDYHRILATVPTITKALPIREIRKEVRHLSHALEGRVVGTTSDYLAFNHLEIATGRFLTDSDNEKFENFAVLAHETSKTLFPYGDPIGESVKLGADYYKIIGVTKERAASAGIGGSLAAQDFNKDVYIPLNTCKLRFGERIINARSGSMEAEETQLSQITLQVGNIDDVQASAPVIEAAIKPFHRKQDYKMVVPYDLLLAAQRTARTYSLILGAIAGISLLVGGIGIMNIMLATVTERTREVGIRRALGAKRWDITQQFLIETIVLSGVGGLLGVAVGVIIPTVIIFFAPDQQAAVTWFSIFFSFGISVAIGMVFGIYPAYRAAHMDPIEALRHE